MKKNLVLILCLSLIFILVGCNSNKKTNKSIQSTKISPNEHVVKDKKNVSQKVTIVNSKVKLYDGTYFDDDCFGDNILKNYCEIVISNVTNTSFDFTVYEVNVVDGKKENKKAIFLTNTAVFTGDGMKATFYGNSYTLNFTFPNYHGAYPAVTDMEISGFKPLEGKTYVNNGIPGHEFGFRLYRSLSILILM
ncbi:hypothetical protein G9F72_004660 [Clostridium estertheticum]|uniref:hypothetical protein n=1 Tax=Clostridium estertheticum TaxID=238834 RepID=UPI0013E96349|nr:hypothetical protein [Clostridium estertheticum]MBZ9685644.1 hypothetical protein [Clostridium estertheticum]